MTETTGAASGGGLPVAGGRETWQVVWRMSHGHRRKLVAAAVLGIVAATAGLVAPAAIGYLVDGVQDGTADAGTVVWVLAVMIAAAIAGAAGTAVTVVLAARSYHAILAELRERLVERAMSLPQSVVEDAGTGDLVSRSSDDVAQVADAAPQIIPAFTTVVFTILATFAGMAALDLWYGLALIVVLPVYVVTVRWYLRTGPRVYRAERAAMSGRAQQLVESQRGHATIVGFDLTEHRHHRVLDASWKVVAHSLRARTVQNVFFGRLNIAEYLGMAAILLAGFWLIDAGQSTVGAATAAMLLFLRLFGPIGQLLIVVDILQSVLASLARMVGVITTPTQPDTAALLLIAPDDGITAIQHVVIIVALPFFLIEFFMMWALLKAMSEDRAAEAPVKTRQWDRTFDADALEEGASRPAPGYDEDGNPLPEPTWQHEDGAWLLEGDIKVAGDLAVGGEIDETWEGPETDSESDTDPELESETNPERSTQKD